MAPRELNLPVVIAVVERAWSGVADSERSGSVLRGLSEISVVLISDRRIAALHGEFMNDPTTTDVITFLHGEIVVSAETARREARERGLPLPQEIARYVVHGLLHLAGWTDADAGAAAEMRLMQEKILRRARGRLC
ncbi:MAG: rRNA maturation RNase YbeY [Chthoniobacterales bacterium]